MLIKGCIGVLCHLAVVDPCYILWGDCVIYMCEV